MTTNLLSVANSIVSLLKHEDFSQIRFRSCRSVINRKVTNQKMYLSFWTSSLPKSGGWGSPDQTCTQGR
uniref:Uncharacterized protein n=1 Tax=Helianthus annuus TaxID=4232 RepID=A0A251THR0_HELAN